MASSTLGQAYVEVHADTGPFEKTAKKKVEAALRDLERSAEKSGKTIGQNLGKAMQEETGQTFQKLTKTAETAGDKIGSGIATHTRKKIKDEEEKTKKEVNNIFLRIFGGVAKSVTSAVGTIFREGFIEAIGAGLKALPPELKIIVGGAIAAAIVSSASLIGAALAGVLTAGLGLTGIAVGIVAAFQDPRVKTAGKGLVETLKQGLTQAASSFIEPTLRGIAVIRQGFVGMLPAIRKIFDILSVAVTPFSRGLVGFVRELLPSLTTAAGNAVPVVAALANELPKVGAAVGQFFKAISSDGAALGLVATLRLVEEALVLLGNKIHELTVIYEFLLKSQEKLTSFMASAWGWVPFVGDQLKDTRDKTRDLLDTVEDIPESFNGTSGAINNTASAADTAKISMDKLNQTFQEAFGVALSVDQAQINVANSLAAVKEAADDAGHSISLNTEKGRALRQSVLDNVNAAIALRDAKFKETGSVYEANKAYLKHIEQLRKTLKQAGLTEAQIDKLIGKYDTIPSSINTNVSVSGVDRSIKQIQELRAELRRLGVDQRAAGVTGRGGATEFRHGGITKAQTGLITNKQTIIFGEPGTGIGGTSKEGFVPQSGISQGRAFSLLSEMAGWHGLAVGPAGGGGIGSVVLVLDGEPVSLKVKKVIQGAMTAEARQVQNGARVI